MLLEKTQFLWKKTKFFPGEGIIFPQFLLGKGPIISSIFAAITVPISLEKDRDPGKTHFSSISAREGFNFLFCAITGVDFTGELPLEWEWGHLLGHCGFPGIRPTSRIDI